ncbi:hypothetical protein EXE43_21625, partial [Halorubrum sp. SS5]
MSPTFDAVEPGVQDVSVTSGADLAEEDSPVTQTQAVDIGDPNDGDNQVTVDISEALAAGVQIDDAATDITASSLPTGVSLDQVSLNADDETITFNVSDSSADGTSHNGTFNLDIDFNTSDVSSDNRVEHVFTDDFSNEETSEFKTLEETSTTIGQGDADTEAFSGEVIRLEGFTAGSATEIAIFEFDQDASNNQGTRVDTVSTAPGTEFNYDTDNLGGGEYVVRFDDGSGTVDRVNVTLLDLGLDAELVDEQVQTDETIEFDANSNDPQGAYTAELFEADADVDEDSPVDTVTGTFDGAGEVTDSFEAPSETGNYTVVVTHDTTD